jgi:hypothetical protein
LFFNSRTKWSPPAKAMAQAAIPAGVEILIKILLIGGIKCFIINAPELPIAR